MTIFKILIKIWKDRYHMFIGETWNDLRLVRAVYFHNFQNNGTTKLTRYCVSQNAITSIASETLYHMYMCSEAMLIKKVRSRTGRAEKRNIKQ